MSQVLDPEVAEKAKDALARHAWRDAFAEANRTGLDYSGTGVNQAARIGASAEGAEIVASGDTISRSRRTFGEVGRRTVELKGISAPVEIVSIAWR